MGALTANNPSSQVGGISGPVVERIPVPVADNVHIYEGALVQVLGGYAYPAGSANTADTHAYLTLGRALSEQDNTVTGHTAGGLTVEVSQGAFIWDNGTSGDLIAATNLGATVYAIDDHTVGLTTGTQAWGAVTHTGTGPAPGPVVSGTPKSSPSNGAINVLIRIVLGGAVATATFQYSTDGGLSWSATTTTAATNAIPNGLTITWTAGTYIADDTYAQSWVGTRAVAGRFLGIDNYTSKPIVQTITV